MSFPMSLQSFLSLFSFLVLIASNLFLVSSASPKGFPTWTFASPNTYMEWNEVPVDRISVKFQHLSDSSADYDLLVVGLSSTNSTTTNASPRLEYLSEAQLSVLKQEIEKNGKAGSVTSIVLLPRRNVPHAKGKGGQQRAAGIHVGNLTKADGQKVGTALMSLIEKQAKASKAKKEYKVCFLIPQDFSSINTTQAEAFIQELGGSLWLGTYKDKRYKSSKSEEDDDSSDYSKTTIQLDVALPTKKSISALEDAFERSIVLNTGVFLARDIVNAPHNVLNSLSLAETASRLAKKYRKNGLNCRIMSTFECEEAGMGAYLGVARGSETPPQFIHLTYRGQQSTKDATYRKLGIVGKGLLMDTGGYNIKTAKMELMKFDCGGAAAVLGAARSIAELCPKDVEVHFLIAACENMINERAVVPGDILTASNGKTIEVINTDAEGRLTMADALVYADRVLQCDEIIELSTLTGACMVALGGSVAGMWTKNDQLASKLLEASDKTGEQIWRMPLPDEYNEQLKSKIADLKNLGGPMGGAITAALFLQNFVEGDKPFAHIDMAGPVWNHKLGQASGFGAKLITEWVVNKN